MAINEPKSKQTKYAKTLCRQLSFRSDKFTFIRLLQKESYTNKAWNVFN